MEFAPVANFFSRNDIIAIIPDDENQVLSKTYLLVSELRRKIRYNF